jgi:hypothetical protein
MAADTTEDMTAEPGTSGAASAPESGNVDESGTDAGVNGRVSASGR